MTPPTPAEVEAGLAALALLHPSARVVRVQVVALEQRVERYRKALERIADSEVNHRWLARAALADDDGGDDDE